MSEGDRAVRRREVVTRGEGERKRGGSVGEEDKGKGKAGETGRKEERKKGETHLLKVDLGI